MMACHVCFTGSDAVVRASLNAGIGVLLVVTAVVLACFAWFFIILARRSRDGRRDDRGESRRPPRIERRGRGAAEYRPDLELDRVEVVDGGIDAVEVLHVVGHRRSLHPVRPGCPIRFERQGDDGRLRG